MDLCARVYETSMNIIEQKPWSVLEDMLLLFVDAVDPDSYRRSVHCWKHS